MKSISRVKVLPNPVLVKTFHVKLRSESKFYFFTRHLNETKKFYPRKFRMEL